MVIEVFKTNVKETSHAKAIIDVLMKHFPGAEINFDLEDCDKILRIKGFNFKPDKVKVLVNEKGFSCSVLDS